MTAVHAEQLVDGYISRLEMELLDLPPDRRREIIDDIRAHIADERQSVETETDADLLNLLDRLGDPAEIAAAARDGQSEAAVPAGNRVGAVEILALVLTPTIWPVGVILLWLSSAWTTRQKLIGTLVPPGGYPGIFFFGPWVMLMHVSVSSCGTTYDASGQVLSNTCPPEWAGTAAVIVFALVVIAVLMLPAAVGIYLATRLRTRPASA